MSSLEFLARGGTMGNRIASHDWSASTLGPIETWPQSLRSTLTSLLQFKFASFLLWGPELIVLYNDAYLSVLGPKPDALGMPFRQVWPEIWETVLPIAEKARRGEAGYFEDLSLVLMRNDHPEETWWTFSASPIMGETGTVEGILAIVQETTERVRSEQRLRFLLDLGNRLRGLVDPREVMTAAEEMLGRHLGASRVGYGEINLVDASLSVERDWSEGGTPTFAGRYGLDDFGPEIAAELKAGHTVRLDDASTDPRTAERHIVAEFIRTGKRANIIVPLIKDGQFAASLYVHQAQPRHWRDDEVVLVQEVAERTWTAVLRARAEAALKESEERFRQFAEHSTDVLWMLDAETLRTEFVSPAYERVWGRPRDCFRDRRQWIETIHPEDRERALQATRSVLQGETVVKEYRIVRPDGSMRRIHATVFPIFGSSGTIQRMAGIARDITQHDGMVVYVVAGDEAARRTLSQPLQHAGYQVKEFSAPQAFLEVAQALVPGCVVLEIATLGAREFMLPRELKGRRAALPVIAVGEARGDVSLGVRAMKAGAVDFLDVPHRPDQLLDAVASALAGIREIAAWDKAAELAKMRIAALSTRERAVLDRLLAGGTSKAIARDLHISPRTVEAHRARIMERLGAHSLPELVQIAVMAGLQAKPQGGARHL